MLSGNVPFRSGSDEETRKLIVKGAFDFKDDVWTCISNPAKDLIMKLLVLDPNKRIQADEALLHY